MNEQESKRVTRPGLLLCLFCAVAIANTTPARATVPVPGKKNTAIDASCGLNGLKGIQAEVLQRVNALRVAGAVCGSTTYAAVAPLSWNSLLLQAARGHSSDMAQNNYFSHKRPGGNTLEQRIRATGYKYTTAGENIAAGQPNVESVVTRWINSPDHCRNLMNPGFRHIGVACVRNNATIYHLYWTMELGGTGRS